LARLYPTVILSLIVAIPTGLYLAATHSTALLLKYYAIKDHYGLWLPLSAVAQMICVTGWLPVAAINQPWNSAAWSLSCEFFFYASFPFLRPAFQRLASRTLIVIMAAGLALQAVWIIGIQSLLPLNRSGFMIAQFPLTHLPEFCLGISTGMLIGRVATKTSALLIFACIAASLLLFVLVRETHANFPQFYFLLPAFAGSVATLALASGSKYLSILRAGILVQLGHASYALYMIHVPILVASLVAGIGGRLGWSWIVLLLAASYMVHFRFAEPIRRAFVDRSNPRAVIV
jgi:peptidoglycan/LPS O-acetylase OafA/YrhL